MRYSIIVCAYNSARTIVNCLQAIADLNYSDFELVLVENNSSDNTFHIANSFLSSGVIAEFSLVQEKSPGLLSARKAGVSVARGEFVVFVDDDNYLTKDYLEIGDRYVSSFDKILVGPRTICFWDNNYESKALACGRQFKATSVLPYKDTLWGCGLIIPTKLARVVLPKVELSGRKGGMQLAGDDTEICLLSYLQGYKSYYSENLVLYHDISIKRLESANYSATLQGFKSSFLRIYSLKSIVYHKYYGNRAIYQWASDTIKSKENILFALYRYVKFVIKTRY